MLRSSAFFSLAIGIAACGGGHSQVSFASTERPSAYGSPVGLPPPSAAALERPTTELPDDDEIIEPERPAADSKQERALVHIHGPGNVVCSGVVVAPRVVATAQQCVKGEPKGAREIPQDREYRVEIASSTLTWTTRRAKYAVLPGCDWDQLDVALLVLAEPAPSFVEPLRIVSAPNTGARVQPLGFGHCAGATRVLTERVAVVRSRVSEAVVIDVPLCRGDTGGPVVDGRDGDIIGVISHADDPEGSPLRTTTIVRLDTVQVRDMLAHAKDLADGKISKADPVSCR